LTYGIAIKLQSGLVLCSDSRTNAGLDQVSTYSKLALFGIDDERQFALISAGNLGTSTAVRRKIQRDIEGGGDSLLAAPDMAAVAEYLGAISREQQEKHIAEGSSQESFNPEATFILAGQIGSAEPEIYMIYPQGNYIAASEQKPFLLIGEVKYGKPILDRIITPQTSIEIAARCCMISMDSTMRSNVTVGPPVELLIYQRDRLRMDCRLVFDEDNEILRSLRTEWQDALERAVEGLTPLSWKERCP
jgi:putative proteasome-type protease